MRLEAERLANQRNDDDEEEAARERRRRARQERFRNKDDEESASLMTDKLELNNRNSMPDEETKGTPVAGSAATDEEQALLDRLAKREERRQRRLQEALERQKELDPTISILEHSQNNQEEKTEVCSLYQENEEKERASEQVEERKSPESNAWAQDKEEEKEEEENQESEEPVQVEAEPEEPQEEVVEEKPRRSYLKEQESTEDKPKKSYMREEFVEETEKNEGISEETEEKPERSFMKEEVRLSLMLSKYHVLFSDMVKKDIGFPVFILQKAMKLMEECYTEVIEEKPKRSYTREEEVIEEKPKRSYTREEEVIEKPTRSHTREEVIEEKPKRSFTREREVTEEKTKKSFVKEETIKEIKSNHHMMANNRLIKSHKGKQLKFSSRLHRKRQRNENIFTAITSSTQSNPLEKIYPKSDIAIEDKPRRPYMREEVNEKKVTQKVEVTHRHKEDVPEPKQQNGENIREETPAKHKKPERTLSRGSVRQSQDTEEQDAASRLEAERKLELLKRRRDETESEEFEKLKQKQHEAEAELEELKKKREERKKILEEEEQRKKQEVAEKKAREEEEKRRMKEEIERRRAEAAEKRQKISDEVPEGEGKKPFKCVSPRGSSLKIGERAEFLNKSAQKSSSVKASHTPIVSKIDNKLEQYTTAIQSNKEPKSPKSPSADLPVVGDGVRNIKSMWEKGNVFSSPGNPQAPNKEAAGLKFGVASRINDWLNKTPESGKTPGAKPADLKPGDVTNKRSLWENKASSPDKTTPSAKV
uniref:Caldesmon 1b n=1 Tax=Lepisosteus oculatus TaxID=7918 RepID=W5LXY0_LEPOC